MEEFFIGDWAYLARIDRSSLMLLQSSLSHDTLIKINELLATFAISRADTSILSISLRNDMRFFTLFVWCCKFKDASVVHKLTNKGLSVGKVVDVIVFELIEECILAPRFNDYRQDLRSIQLRRGHEINLTKQRTQRCHRLRVAWDLLSKAIDLYAVWLKQAEVDLLELESI